MSSVEVIKRRHYRERNLANGKCADCREARDPKSTRFCLRHLTKNRDSQRRYRAQWRGLR